MKLSSNKPKFVFIVIITSLVIWGIMNNTNEYYELNENGKLTQGEVIDINFIREAKYQLIYEYTVNSKKYQSSVNTSLFGCDGRRDGCVGKKFTVIYSQKKPQISDIDLKEFNSKKYGKIHF